MLHFLPVWQLVQVNENLFSKLINKDQIFGTLKVALKCDCSKGKDEISEKKTKQFFSRVIQKTHIIIY